MLTAIVARKSLNAILKLQQIPTANAYRVSASHSANATLHSYSIRTRFLLLHVCVDLVVHMHCDYCCFDVAVVAAVGWLLSQLKAVIAGARHRVLNEKHKKKKQKNYKIKTQQ